MIFIWVWIWTICHVTVWQTSEIWANTKIIVVSIRKWICYLKLVITVITPIIIITLLSLCPSSMLSSIYSPNSCHLSQYPLSNFTPLPTLTALSCKISSLLDLTLFITLVPGTHLQPKHQFKQHITIYSTPPILHHTVYVLLGYSHWSWSHYPLWHTHPPARLEFWHVIPWSSASAPTLLKWMEYHQANRSATWWASHIMHSFSVCCPHSIWASQNMHPIPSMSRVSHPVFGSMEALYAKPAWIRDALLSKWET